MHQRDTTFYGWTNRPTWAVAQLIREYPDLDRERRELCRHAVAEPSCQARQRLASLLRQWVTGLAERSRDSRECQASSIRLLLDVLEVARRHRNEMRPQYHHTTPPDQILAISLEAWAVGLSEVVLQDDEAGILPLHHFEDIGSFCDVNWLELADTFLVEAD